MNSAEIETTARALVAPGKGILAADESLGTIEKRFKSVGVAGIVFLSGGQSDVRATEHLNALNKLGEAPWELSFSFGRALQAPALQNWKGAPANVSAAQKALFHRAQCNCAARSGNYSTQMEKSQS